MERRLIVFALLFAACAAPPRVARTFLSAPPSARGADQNVRATRSSPLRIVVIGDSVAHGLAAAMHVDNLGINGARTWNVLRHLRDTHVRASVAAADLVIVSIGGNDLYGDSAARVLTTLWPSHAMTRTLDRVERIVSTLRRANPTARIALLGLYDPYRTPSLDRKVNEWDARLIDRFAAARDVDVIRIADLFHVPRLSPADHFHPSQQAYELIAQRVLDGF